MQARRYRLGRRQEAVDQTRTAILDAARELLAAGDHKPISVGAVAGRAGVSRLTIYNRFGSRAALLRAVLDEARRRAASSAVPVIGEPRGLLHQRITESCLRWAADPSLFRRLPEVDAVDPGATDACRTLAGQLAATDQLRPGCSLKEAEDVIGTLTCFGTFDRLYKDGRRSTTAVAEILMRLAAGILR